MCDLIGGMILQKFISTVILFVVVDSGLFVKHTHTGNPLVDSVAEHQVCFFCEQALHLLQINTSLITYFLKS
jgi:hypothetical protein